MRKGAKGQRKRVNVAARAAGGLTPKQRLFCLEYLANGCNATQAAISAGYSERTAANIGSENLGKPEIRAVIESQLAKRAEKLELTVERLDLELARMAYVDPAGAYDEDGKLLPIKEMPEDVRRAIAGFEEEALFDTVETGELGPRGGKVKERVQVGVVRKVKWHSKPEAVQLGMKRLGLLTEKVEHTGNFTDFVQQAAQKALEAARAKKA